MADYERTPYLIVTRESHARKDVYGSIDDAVVLQAQLLRGEEPRRTAFVAMHPIGSPGYLPMFANLARCGHHVIACATRYSTGDAALQMENVLLDLGACVKDARDRLDYEKLVLVGWSGGGSLMATYQAEATKRTITRTAAGEESPLADIALPPADGLMLLAAHRSRHHLLSEWLDPSVLDESDPSARDPGLDLYDPDNSERPPYTADFVSTFREAQRARSARITDWAREQLASIARSRRPDAERCFVVHGTMADPRWLDPTIDPNDRQAGWSYLGDPAIANHSAAGLARFTTTRSWLSQWGLATAQVDAVAAGPRIAVPTLVVTAGADDACPVSHTAAIVGSLAASDTEHHTIAGANHYFSGPDGRRHLAEAGSVIDRWAVRTGFAD